MGRWQVMLWPRVQGHYLELYLTSWWNTCDVSFGDRMPHEHVSPHGELFTSRRLLKR